MKVIYTKAYAKLNLTLDVTAKRDDGYHDMLMVMQTVSLTDQIVITQTEGKEIRASSRQSMTRRWRSYSPD